VTPPSVVSAVRPRWAIPGGRIAIQGIQLPVPVDGPPHVLVGTHDARVVAASSSAIKLVVPVEAEGGTMPVRIDELPGETAYLEVATVFATGVHQVDSPVFDASGRLCVTQSGGRDTKVPVPLYRVSHEGIREPLAVEIANPTSMVLGPDRAMYVSSRFEGQVYRLGDHDRAEVYASELGVATGLAFAPDGTLFVGDRSGSILAVLPDKRVEIFATLPASVAAFHLAFGPDGCLYVAAPTFATHDPVYRIRPDRTVETVYDGFGRPQGLAFDANGALYVVEALAGAAGLYRLDVSTRTTTPELIVAAPALVGVTMDPRGGLILASNEVVWRLDVDVHPPGRSAR
jgi:sugar lactone lactonase YvrE